MSRCSDGSPTTGLRHIALITRLLEIQLIQETETVKNRVHHLPTTFGMKSRTRIAFWNVRTLSDDSRLAQAEAEMLRYNLHVLGLSEVRRNGFGELRTSKGLTLLYSGQRR